MDTGILPTFCHIHDVWPWAGHLISLNLNPLLCIMGDNSIYLIVLFLMIKWIISNQVLKLRASLIAQLVKIWLQCRRPQFDPWVGKICWRRDRLPTPVLLGFPCGSAGKESCNVRDLGSIPGLGRSPGEGKGCSLQYSCLENPMEACWAALWTSHISLDLTVKYQSLSSVRLLGTPWTVACQAPLSKYLQSSQRKRLANGWLGSIRTSAWWKEATRHLSEGHLL